MEQKLFSKLLKRIFFTVKLTVTISLSIWIIWHVDWHEMWNKLGDISPWLILVVVSLRFLGITISAHKWQRLLAVQGLRYSMGQLQSWYLVAMFLNYFLPTSIGGDSYRIYKTLNNPRSKVCALLAVGVERISGIVALLLLGYVAALCNYARNADELSGSLIVLGTVGILVALIGMWIIVRWQLLQKLKKAKPYLKPLSIFIQFAGEFWQHPREIFIVSIISFIFHIIIILAYWLLIYALGTRCNFIELIIVVALINVVGLLPISLGGLGVVDGAFVYFMGYYGIDYETSLSAMLLWRCLLIPMNLLGAYFYCVGDRQAQTIEPSAIEQS